MKTNKIIISAILAVFWGMPHAYSRNIEQIHLKDGSVIDGYICEQVPGKGVTVQGYKAIMVAGADSMTTRTDRTVQIGELSSEWKSWLMEQNVTPDDLQLSTLKFNNSEFADVHVLADGDELKFLSLTPRQYYVTWQNLAKVGKMRRPSEQQSGLDDIIIMNDGTRYSGQVYEQTPGRNVKINTSAGNDVTVNVMQVAEIQSVPVSEQLSVIEQSPLLDRIFIIDDDNPIEGVIVSRKTGNSVTINTVDNDVYTYSIRDIAKYQKRPNADYKVLTDTPIEKGVVLLNGDTKNAWFADLETIGGYIVLGEYVSMVAEKGVELVLEANLDNPLAVINVAKTYTKEIAAPGEKGTKVRDVVTYQDLLESQLSLSRTTTPLGNTKVVFTLDDPGDYVVLVQGKKGFIVIQVN